MTGQEIMQGYGVMFPAPLRLAHEAVLLWSREMEPDRWPSIPAIVRFSRCYGVDVGQLAALCGILSYKVGRKTIFCDSRREPAVVHRTTANKFSRKVLAAYGYYVTAATMVARDRAVVH